HRLVRGVRRDAARGAGSHRRRRAAAPAREHPEGPRARGGGRAAPERRSGSGAARVRALARRRAHHDRALPPLAVGAGAARLVRHAHGAGGDRLRPAPDRARGGGTVVTTRTKLLLAQAPLAVAVVVLGVVAARALAALAEQGSRVLADNYRSIVAVERMKDAL